ncbi:MAG: trypsin-like peptidase domain-containing protein [Oligoflexia bacterium]|nr:trypsin-like peptidase domain-containing protein [Oligoflexia bacterium]
MGFGFSFTRVVIFSLLIFVFLGLVMFPHNTVIRNEYQKMEFVEKINSEEIFKNIDLFLDRHQRGEISYQQYLKEKESAGEVDDEEFVFNTAIFTASPDGSGSGSSGGNGNASSGRSNSPIARPSEVITSRSKSYVEYYGSDISGGYFGTDQSKLPPTMNKIWNSTVMLLGATADGLGIGTGFIVKRLAEDKGIIFTAYHVIEAFCDIPNNLVKAEGAFKCKMLFALNNVAIDTKTNKVTYDGQDPWKAAVKKVIFVDKLNDFAAIEFSIPNNFKTEELKIVYDYDLKDPKIEKKDIKFVKKGRTNLIDAREIKKDFVKLRYFNIWSIGYPSIYKKADGNYVHDKHMIRKRWTDGSFEKFVSYETPDSLGFVKVFTHTQNMLPGMSGSAFCMSDGRIIGMNISLILNKSFQRRFGGCTKKIILEKIKLSVPFNNLSEYINKHY